MAHDTEQSLGNHTHWKFIRRVDLRSTAAGNNSTTLISLLTFSILSQGCVGPGTDMTGHDSELLFPARQTSAYNNIARSTATSTWPWHIAHVALDHARAQNVRSAHAHLKCTLNRSSVEPETLLSTV